VKAEAAEKRGPKRREAALAEPTLLPGVCPRSDVIELDADRMQLVARNTAFGWSGAKFV
jgi:hypothetical protein